MSLHAMGARAPRPETTFGSDEARELLGTCFSSWLQELGLVVESCTRERTVLRMPWSPRLARPGNTLSGQAMLAAADSAIAVAICGAFGRFQDVTTVSQTMTFMRAIPAGDVEIEAVVRKLGRSLVFAEAFFRAAGRPETCAHAFSTWAVLQGNAA